MNETYCYCDICGLPGENGCTPVANCLNVSLAEEKSVKKEMSGKGLNPKNVGEFIRERRTAKLN